jgi:hypothetical protein
LLSSILISWSLPSCVIWSGMFPSQEREKKTLEMLNVCNMSFEAVVSPLLFTILCSWVQEQKIYQ